MKVQPYLFFGGRCEEAIEFYKRALGAEALMLMRFKENPELPPPGMVPPRSENKIMHASMRIGESEVMASDGRSMGNPAFQGVSLSLSVSARPRPIACSMRLARAASQVQMPIGKTFFSPRFGMVADRIGVSWMIVTTPTT